MLLFNSLTLAIATFVFLSRVSQLFNCLFIGRAEKTLFYRVQPNQKKRFTNKLYGNFPSHQKKKRVYFG